MPYADLVADHGTEVITGLIITQGFSGGTDVSGLLRWWQICWSVGLTPLEPRVFLAGTCSGNQPREADDVTQYWWVNQSQSYDDKRGRGILLKQDNLWSLSRNSTSGSSPLSRSAWR